MTDESRTVQWTHLRAELVNASGLSKSRIVRLFDSLRSRGEIAPEKEPTRANALMMTEDEAAKVRAAVDEAAAPPAPGENERETSLPPGNPPDPGTVNDPPEVITDAASSGKAGERGREPQTAREFVEAPGPRPRVVRLKPAQPDPAPVEPEGDPTGKRGPFGLPGWAVWGGLAALGLLVVSVVLRRKKPAARPADRSASTASDMDARERDLEEYARKRVEDLNARFTQ